MHPTRLTALRTSLRAISLFLGMVIAIVFFGPLSGCSRIWPGWAVDYGTSAIHLTAKNAPARATPFKHRRVTVEGKVTRIDASDPRHLRVYLDGVVNCDFGKTWMGLSSEPKPGDILRVAGVVQRADGKTVTLSPCGITTEPLIP